MNYRYWLLLNKDLTAPIGGVKQMHRLAEAITFHGRDAVLIQDSANFHPGWFDSNVSTISYDDWISLPDLDPSTDRIIIPETYVPVIKKYAPTIPKVVFNQNGSYTFGIPPSETFDALAIKKIYSSNIVASVLCVSRYDEYLLSDGLGLGHRKVSRIVNTFDTHKFSPAQKKKKQIVFMPRKNSRDSHIVVSLLQSLPWKSRWSIRKLSNCSHDEVASVMGESLIFLSFGHPEGFGLPVAEAIASGCAVIGYSGLGGNELFDPQNSYGITHKVQYGDWMGFVDAVRDVVDSIDSQPDFVLSSLIAGSTKIKESYSTEYFLSSVKTALHKIENSSV